MTADPPDYDDDPEMLLDPELQAEHDRLLAEFNARARPRVRLADDLEELIENIRDVRVLRNAYVKDPPPYIFGRFEAFDIKRGGMGLVIEARDPQLERKVAIKLWIRSGSEAQAALLAEAKTLAKLKHPNVVAIYEPGVWNDRVYFVMEWIEGLDGHDWMDEPRSWREVLAVYIAAGTGLAAAHDAGIQHRDFKPSNILIGDDGHVVVADFGIADSLQAVPEDDEAGKFEGTPSYMAPERLRGKRGDARSDQFAFCVAMWRAMYRQRPYAGRTGEELLESIERGEFRVTPGVDVPSWLSAVVRKGLADDPDERFRDMHELLEALRGGPDDDELTDEPSTVEVVGGGGPRVLHSPEESGTTWHSPALTFLLPMLLASGIVIGGVVDRLVSHPRQTEMTDPTTAEPVGSPCASLGAGKPELDAVVLEVCGLIRGHHLQAADALWEREYMKRFADVDADPELGEDALIVAATFVAEAEVLAQQQPDVARAAAGYARIWGFRTADLLGPEDGQVLRISARIDYVLAKH